jgi:hypothetical protein
MLGFIATILPILIKILAPIILIIGCFIILKNKDRGNQALFFAAYVCGIEVFLRMTGANFFNEYGKYTISLFCFLGILFHPVRSDKILFIFLFLLLVPAIFIGLLESSFETNLRKSMMFNLSGELCLLVSCLYTINKKITYNQLINLTYVIGLPILSITSYVIFKTSENALTMGTNSNFATSGGFGPNQVSTILGLGTFCMFALFLLKKASFIEKCIYLILCIICAYRGVITFSRGGMICAGVMILALLIYVFLISNDKTKFRILVFSFVGGLGFLFFWGYAAYSTDGLIVKRYNNQDAIGRTKESKLTGRETLIETEFNQFLDNPIFGVGVGRNKELRYEETGIQAASHNEISRLMAEHGMFGIIYLLIIIALPFILWFNNRQHVLMLSFFIFWALTINHAAMRTAAPAFIYALCLLRIYIPQTKNSYNENSIYREFIAS